MEWKITTVTIALEGNKIERYALGLTFIRPKANFEANLRTSKMDSCDAQ